MQPLCLHRTLPSSGPVRLRRRCDPDSNDTMAERDSILLVISHHQPIRICHAQVKIKITIRIRIKSRIPSNNNKPRRFPQAKCTIEPQTDASHTSHTLEPATFFFPVRQRPTIRRVVRPHVTRRTSLVGLCVLIVNCSCCGRLTLCRGGAIIVQRCELRCEGHRSHTALGGRVHGETRRRVRVGGGKCRNGGERECVRVRVDRSV